MVLHHPVREQKDLDVILSFLSPFDPSKGKGLSTFGVALPTSFNSISLICLEVISKVILDPTNLTTSVDQECNIIHKAKSKQPRHLMCLTLREIEHGKKAKTL